MTRAARVRRVFLVTHPDQATSWVSLNRVLPALRKAWLSTALAGPPPSSDVRSLHFNLQDIHEVLFGAARPDLIVFTFFDEAVSDLILMLRKHLDDRTPIAVHLHGEGTQEDFAHSGEAFHYLTENDLFIAASRADARVFRSVFPNARVSVIPFPIPVPRVKSLQRPRGGACRPFFYLGRISEQKNLHSLLLAFKLLRERTPGKNLELHVFGEPDRWGSPAMGMPGIAYLPLLKRMARDLGLGSSVKWRGFLDQGRLALEVYSKPHIFVSASLHSYESWGTAAYTSLMLGNPAVLSAWGGHRDFIHRFPDRVFSTRVYGKKSGPFVSPVELAKRLERALSCAPRGALKPRGDIQKQYCRIIARAARVSRKRLRSLKIRPFTRKWIKRRISGGGRRLYTGYDDPMAIRGFRAYGMENLPRFSTERDRKILLPPWVELGPRHSLSIRDPHRGTRRLPLRLCHGQHGIALLGSVSREDSSFVKIPPKLARQLVENGWAFTLESRR